MTQLIELVDAVIERQIEVIEPEYDGECIPYLGEPEDEYLRRTR